MSSVLSSSAFKLKLIFKSNNNNVIMRRAVSSSSSSSSTTTRRIRRRCCSCTGTTTVKMMLSTTTTTTTTNSNNNNIIKQKVIECEEYFKLRGGPAPDTPATATLVNVNNKPEGGGGGGLLCEVTSPLGKGTIYTDMPEGIGGTMKQTQYNSPGWHLRAAIAACDVTMIKIRASRLDLDLNSIAVIVESSSDGRGMLLEETTTTTDNNGNDVDTTGVVVTSAGSTEMNITYKIGIKGTNTTPQQVHELIDWVEKHSPVATDVKEGIRNRMKGKIELV